MPGARGEAQPYEGHHPGAHHAIPGEGMSLQKRPAIHAQQIECANVHEKVDPHGKQAAGERSQSGSPVEVIGVASAVGE